MSFVYRYVDESGAVRYIGKVSGVTAMRLKRRIGEHSHEQAFDPSWHVEYIGDLSDADADILETWLIAKCPQAPLINKGKRWGKTEISFSKIPAFSPYDPDSISTIECSFTELQKPPSPGSPEPHPFEPLLPNMPSAVQAYPQFLSLKEAASITGLSMYCLRRGVKDGSIPHMRCGGEKTGTIKIPKDFFFSTDRRICTVGEVIA